MQQLQQHQTQGVSCFVTPTNHSRKQSWETNESPGFTRQSSSRRDCNVLPKPHPGCRSRPLSGLPTLNSPFLGRATELRDREKSDLGWRHRNWRNPGIRSVLEEHQKSRGGGRGGSLLLLKDTTSTEENPTRVNLSLEIMGPFLRGRSVTTPQFKGKTFQALRCEATQSTLSWLSIPGGQVSTQQDLTPLWSQMHRNVAPLGRRRLRELFLSKTCDFPPCFLNTGAVAAPAASPLQS